jgi:hypothetical protein
MKIAEIILEAAKTNPVYHGTSTRLWSQKATNTLYLTNDLRDAETYAEEAAWNGGAAIVVTFSLDELLALTKTDPTLEFDPDWGWQDGERVLGRQPTWQESLQHAHSFSIAGFKQQYKSFGIVQKL